MSDRSADWSQYSSQVVLWLIIRYLTPDLCRSQSVLAQTIAPPPQFVASPHLVINIPIRQLTRRIGSTKNKQPCQVLGPLILPGISSQPPRELQNRYGMLPPCCMSQSKNWPPYLPEYLSISFITKSLEYTKHMQYPITHNYDLMRMDLPENRYVPLK